MLEAVIKAITPKIMTWGQYMEAAWFMYNKKVLNNPAFKRYVPDYTKCIDHFALHAGEQPGMTAGGQQTAGLAVREAVLVCSVRLMTAHRRHFVADDSM